MLKDLISFLSLVIIALRSHQWGIMVKRERKKLAIGIQCSSVFNFPLLNEKLLISYVDLLLK